MTSIGYPRTRSTALGLAGALILLLGAGDQKVAAQQSAPPGCPPTEGNPGCSVFVNLTDGGIRLQAFTPNSPVQFEVFVSPGGTRRFGPVTKQTDGGGNQQVAFLVTEGDHVVVTDLATGTVKTLDIGPLSIDVVNLDDDKVSGKASPGSIVSVPLSGAGQMANAIVQTDETGSWLADFAAQGADVTEFISVNALVYDLDGDVVSATPAPGCPPVHPGRTCKINVDASDKGGVQAVGFTPNSPVRFELYESVGGPRLYGPVTRETDRAGNQNRDYGDTRILIRPGMYFVVTDVATGTVKRLEVSPLSIDSIDIAADTVSGSARPGDTVFVGLHGTPSVDVVADAQGSWTADFSATHEHLDESSFPGALVFDADFDATNAGPSPGCPGRGFFRCLTSAAIEHDTIGVLGFTPNSDVVFEVFDAPGGRRLLGPITKRTDAGGDFFMSFGFNPGPDIIPGTYVVSTDVATNTVKTLAVAQLSADRVDPVTDVVEGRAPSGSTVSVEGEGATRNLEVTADSQGNWVADFSAVGYDIKFVDFFRVSVQDADGDFSGDSLGAPIPGCEPDADTTCGSAGPDTIRESDGEVISGLGGDTLLINSDDPSDSVRIMSGSGSDGIVLPAHAGRFDARVFGGAGADRMITRAFGGGGASSGSYFLDGGGGDDSMKGGDGDDTLHGGGGANEFNGGPGQDTCLSDTRRDDFKGCERIRRNHRRNHQQA